MIAEIKAAMGTIKLVAKIAAVIAIIGALWFGINLYKENQELKLRNDDLNSNSVAYENIISGKVTENNVLKLTIGQLENSGDKMVRRLDSLRKVVKIKDKQLTMAYGSVVTLTDTLKVPVVIDDSCNFSTEVEFNNQTKIKVTVLNDSVEVIPTITDTMSLLVWEAREYKNPRKGWFDRLIHLDYKKKNVSKYEVKNSNPAIKVDDVRVIYKEPEE